MKRAYIYAGAASTALFAMATAFPSGPLVNTLRTAVESPVEIEKVRERELKRLQKMDEDEDGSVSREEFSSHSKAQRPEDVTPRKGGKLGGIMRWADGGSSRDHMARMGNPKVMVKRLKVKDGADMQGKVEVEVEVEDIVDEALEGMNLESAHEFINLLRADLRMPANAQMIRMRREVVDREKDPSRWFDIADANGDDVLDRDEVAGARDRVREEGVNKRFDSLDENADGVLNDEDIDLGLKRLEALDSDGDGAVSDRELNEVMRMLGKDGMTQDEHRVRIIRENGPR